MRTTLKRIDIGSGFRVGFILYGLIFAVFGLFFVLMQAALINAFRGVINGAVTNVPTPPANQTIFVNLGVLTALCFYGVGVVFAAVVGGIQGALIAFLYNVTAHWVGGLKIELQTEGTDLLDDIERDSYPRKRDDL